MILANRALDFVESRCAQIKLRRTGAGALAKASDGLERLKAEAKGGRDCLILQELESLDDAQERDREAKGLFASPVPGSHSALASPPFSRLFIIRANKVSQQAAGLERKEGMRWTGGGTRVGRASGATGLNKIIKRLKEFPRSPDVPGISFPLALCAEYPRGNFEEDSGKRRRDRE